ncbi:putative membrane protein YkvI [Trueperella bonasi]|uniref:Membrane protein YkvI n=1 Tax=Trueperella bonasi TaxID=312286 RepID=A0ABT9NGP7_9ACTO|nr:hypothetical protein [Trueperella bonasi]MDP9806545.1 putative membrane protein YkvI [Trueperella bonasi]
MLKRVIVIALAYIGVVVGAGFASGQEVLQYFVAHGRSGIVAVAITAALMAAIGVAALQLGSYAGAKEHSTVFNQIAHPLIARALDAFIVFTLFGIGFVMIAGAGSNLEQQFGLPVWVGSAIMVTLVVSVGMLDVEKVTNIIGGLTPLMVVIILAATVYAFLNPDGSITEMQVYSYTVEPALSNLALSTINYVAFAFATGASMMIVMGGDMFNPKEAGVGGLLGGLGFGTLLVLSTMALFLKLPSVSTSPMPTLALIDSINPTFGLIAALVIYGMIFNTAIGMYYALAKRAAGVRKTFFKPTLFGTVTIGFALSFLGFEELVGTLYPIIGYVGIALTVLIIVGWFTARSKISEETSRRARIRRLFRLRWEKQATYSPENHEELTKHIEASTLDNHEVALAVRDEIVAEIEADPNADVDPVLAQHHGYQDGEFGETKLDFPHPAELRAESFTEAPSQER